MLLRLFLRDAPDLQPCLFMISIVFAALLFQQLDSDLDLGSLETLEPDFLDFPVELIEDETKSHRPKRSSRTRRSNHFAQRERLSSLGEDRLEEENLFFEIALVEMSKEFLREWGARFSSPLDFDLIMGRGSGLQAFKFTGLNPIGGFVDFALDQGKARIHFKQSILARPKRASEFHVGGELPVRVSSRHHSHLSKISYGMTIQIVLVQRRSTDLLIELRVDVREPISGGLENLPRISEKRLNTDIKLKMNESLSIAGFFRESEMSSKKGLPFVSEIPLLGSLFSSQAFLKNESEAFFVITAKKVMVVGVGK